MLQFFIAAWVLLVIDVVMGSCLYIFKILPALRAKNGQAGWEVWPSDQMRQWSEYLSMHEMAQPKPWFYSYVKCHRWVNRLEFSVFVFFIVYVTVMGSHAF
jgi:hypothetical protein